MNLCVVAGSELSNRYKPERGMVWNCMYNVSSVTGAWLHVDRAQPIDPYLFPSETFYPRFRFSPSPRNSSDTWTIPRRCYIFRERTKIIHQIRAYAEKTELYIWFLRTSRPYLTPRANSALLFYAKIASPHFSRVCKNWNGTREPRQTWHRNVGK